MKHQSKFLCLIACMSLLGGCGKEQVAAEPEMVGCPIGEPEVAPEEIQQNEPNRAAAHGVIHANSEAEVTALIAEGNVVLDVFAPWCGPCKFLAPILEEIARDCVGKIKFVKIDGDTHSNVAQKYGVTHYPTLIFFKDGKPVDKVVGNPGKGSLQNRMRQLYNA